MSLSDALGVKFYELVSGATGPCSNHSADAPCTNCLDAGVEAAKKWLAGHSCATCRWAEWGFDFPRIIPTIGSPTAPDVFASPLVCACVRVGAVGSGIKPPDGYMSLIVSPNFGCVMWEAKP